MSNVIVTIRCIVYNHEPFLRQCLDGFVMQQTNFPFEAIVHDDASTDGSAAIIREYAEKYPDIIKPIIETENQYSKHDGSIRRIMDAHTRGKYVAYCEGDDYWTDPLKLQKQVDFLESHPDYSMCFHKAKVIDGNGKEIENYFPDWKEGEYSGSDVIREWIVPTASMVLRKEVIDRIPENKKFRVGDNVVIATCSCCGRLYGIDTMMSVYRRHIGGWMSLDLMKRHRDLIDHWKAMKESFPENLHDGFNERLFWHYSEVLHSKLVVKNYKSAFVVAVSGAYDVGMPFLLLLNNLFISKLRRLIHK